MASPNYYTGTDSPSYQRSRSRSIETAWAYSRSYSRSRSRSRSRSPMREWRRLHRDDTFRDPEYSITLKRELLDMTATGAFSDVTLIVGDRRFMCHRNILSAMSHYFKAMFTSGMKEQHNKEVPIVGIEAETLSSIIDYIYTGQVKMYEETVRGLCEAADMFQMEELKEGCANYLYDSLTPQNCLSIWKMADCHNIKPLAENAYSYALKHFYEVSDHEDFKNMSEKDVSEYLGSTLLKSANEEAVLEAATSWLLHDPSSDSSRVSSTMAVLSTVRLIDVDPGYLRCQLRSNKAILSCPDAVEYIKALLDHMIFDLPRPTTLPPLTPRLGTMYQRGICVLGGEKSTGVKCEVLTNYTWAEDSLYRINSVPLGPGYDPSASEFFDNHRHRPYYMNKYPKYYHLNMACCEMGGNLYISGYGKNRRKVWRFETNTQTWQYYSKLLYPREAHIMLTGNKTHIYVAAGFKFRSERTYHLHTTVEEVCGDSPNHELGELVQPVYLSAAVFYNDCIYLFGGKDESYSPTSIIQYFNIHSREATKLDSCLPKPYVGLKPILYGDWIILLGDSDTLVSQMDIINLSKDNAQRQKNGCSAVTDKDEDVTEDVRKLNESDNSNQSGKGLDKAGNKTLTGEKKITEYVKGKSLRTRQQSRKREYSPDSNDNDEPFRRVLRKRKVMTVTLDTSDAKRVIEINDNNQPSSSRNNADNISKQNNDSHNNVFVMKTGVCKEEFGAELLGNSVYIFGGREPSAQGLFDYSKCILRVHLCDLINPEITDLAFVSVYSLDSYMSVFMTCSIRMFQPLSDGEDNSDQGSHGNNSPHDNSFYSRSPSRSPDHY